MKEKLLLAVTARTTAKSTRAVPSKYWIFFPFKIHWYGKSELFPRDVWKSPATEFATQIQKEAFECPPVEGKQHGALNLYRNWRIKGILVQSFQILQLKKCSLTEWLPSAVLSQAAWHRSLSLSYSQPEVCSWMLPHHCPSMERWPGSELLQSQNEWIDNLFFSGVHARGLLPR